MNYNDIDYIQKNASATKEDRICRKTYQGNNP